MISFRSKFMLALTAVLVVALVAMTWVVVNATRKAADNFAARELAVAEKVFIQQLANNRQQLTGRARLLAEDFGFRRAIATGEQDTLISVLANHGERVGATLVLLTEPDGRLVLSSHELDDGTGQLQQVIAGAQDATSLLVVAEGEAFQLALVPVQAPNLIAWVGLGFAIDLAALESLKAITKAEVALLLDGSIRLNTLNRDLLGRAPGELISAGDWLVRTINLGDLSSHRLGAVLFVSSSELAQPFAQLQRQMQAIAVAALVIALIAAALLARSITRPVEKLVAAAGRMAGGDYDQPVAMVSRDELGSLASALNTMQDAVRSREQRIRHQATHDEETGLLNSFGLREQIGEWFAAGKAFSFALVSLENYGRVIDLYGYSFLHSHLPTFADKLHRHMVPGSLTARVARDQLAVAAPLAVDDLQQRLASAMAQPWQAGPVQLQWDIRQGLVACPEGASDTEQLLRRANVALKQSRLRSLQSFCYQRGLDEQYLRKLQISQRLQRVVSDGGLELFYQPQRHLASGKIIGAEALLRWRDAELGQVFPDEFIPLAEESGSIGALTRWVLQQAQVDARRLAQVAGLETLSINLSANDLLDTGMLEQLLAAHRSLDDNATRLEFEVTETALVQDADTAVRHLRSLEAAGISLAMDDFGTGYSSLSQLKMLPVSKLKVDKSFVLKLAENAEDQSIVKATIAMAKALSLEVIAEGVEDEPSSQLLASWGCDVIQGYHLARPMPLNQFLEWLDQYHEKSATAQTVDH